MSSYDVVIAIPRSGRTFENFINRLIELGAEKNKLKLILEAVGKSKKYKSYSPKIAQEYTSSYKEIADNLGVFVDRKREERPYRVGFIGINIELGGLKIRIEGDEPHNCSSLVSLGEADIALAGFDELLTVSNNDRERVNKWGMYNYNIPTYNKVRIAGSAMLTRWNSSSKKKIQDIVGFFLIAKKGFKEVKGYSFPKDYLKHLEHLQRHGNKVFVKGRYVDIIRNAYPLLNIKPVHDVEDAVEESELGNIGIEIVQTGSTLKEKNLIVLGAPLFLSESLYVVDYFRFLENDNMQSGVKNNIEKILNILKPQDYFSSEKIKYFELWYSALEKNLNENWINKPDISDLFCNKDNIEYGLRPTRLQTRYWRPSDTYKRDEANNLIKEAIENLNALYHDSHEIENNYGTQKSHFN